MESEIKKLQSLGIDLSIAADQYDDSLKKIQGKYSPVSIFLITLIGIAVAEIIADWKATPGTVAISRLP